MSKIKKILLIVLAIILLIVVVQIVNAAKYRMVVNVVEGENVMGINPLADKLDFGDLSRNNGMTRYVTLKSAGGISTYIAVLKFGEISDLVKVDKNFFTLNPGEEVKLAFEIQIPPSAETRKYGGWTVIFRIPKIF
ncbi:hypothetical protein AMJ49_00620 [Parcubacteria bacterium DG_74_2]|nr:MAG: hypothetical protein AMJ49_00620 [Parcubacteria bacterium DG_74_2]